MSKITWLFPSGSTVRLRQITGGFVEMIAMKKHFHIQKYSPVSHLKLTFRIITLTCLQGTYGMEIYQNLDV